MSSEQHRIGPDTLVFCHGLESGPVGRKVVAMREAGIDVVSPDFRGQALAARMDTLYAALGDARPVLVGSSYGGLVAACAAAQVGADARFPALVLCAPALMRAEPPADSLELVANCPTVIIHGTRDDIVPIEGSRLYAARAPELVTLHEVDDDHGLSSSLDLIVRCARDALTTASG